MATYNFDGSTSSTVTFDPLNDVLSINGLSAANVEITKTDSSVIIMAISTGNTITLTGAHLNELTTTNVVFDDGSVLFVGDDSTDNGDQFGNTIDLSASTEDNQVFGLGGDDTIFMGDGSDIVKGSQGDDFMNGAGGDDLLKGNQGRDTIIGGAGDDTLLGKQGKDDLDGDDGNDLLMADQGMDTLDGGSGDDTLFGAQGKDVLDGGSGNDYLRGGEGKDTITGGAGDDTLLGNVGKDRLEGGTGDDTITGGPGLDEIIFNSTSDGTDLITDFDHAESDLGGDNLLFNGGINTSQFQWGYQSDSDARANIMGPVTSDFLLEAPNKGALLNAVSNAASGLFGTTIASGASSVAYFFGFTIANSGLYYIIANQHTVTGAVTTTISTFTLATLDGITGVGTGMNQLSPSDIILF